MKKIHLKLHKEDNSFVLNSQDVFDFIGESTTGEIEIALYIDKWCEYLNYYIYNNKEMMFGDPFYARLEGWLNGYNYAKHIVELSYKDRVELKMRGYEIILDKPYQIEE